MNQCYLTVNEDGVISCAYCGRPYTKCTPANIPRVHRKCLGIVPPRTEEDIKEIATICLACPYLRDHKKAGLRCAHKDCKCGKGEQETIELIDRIWNGGLVYRMRTYGRCPDLKW